MELFKMVAKTLFGLEDELAKELRNLGAQRVEVGTRAVSFYGDKGFMYKANLCLRTALKILKPLAHQKVTNNDELYHFVQSITWSDYLHDYETFVVDVTMHSTHFDNSMFVALKTKDAIVDQFRKTTGKRPGIDKLHPTLRIHVHIDRDMATLSLDTSGASLHQRGYRSSTNIAPINEVLAAGMLLLAGWNGDRPFLDPMCGSGTLLVEAAMIACNIPANIQRKEFAFEKWHDWDVDLFEKLVEGLMKRTKEFHFSMVGYDKAPSAVAKARENIKLAHLEDYIQVEQRNFFETQKEVQGPLFMLFNPPYGERLEIDLPYFYRSIGDTFKLGYPNTEAWFITSQMEALKNVGLKPSRKIQLFNGKLETRLVRYDIYEGSKKAKYQDS
jgi:putative N6-adenine-specific DNA methylase